MAARDEVDVNIYFDDRPREVEVPADLAAALESAGAGARFDALAFSYRKEHARTVEDAKTDETRQRRIAKIVASLQSSDGPT